MMPDEDDTSYGDHWKKLKKLKSKGSQIRQRGGSYAKPRQHIVTHYNATTQALIRRKVKVIDKDALYHVKVSVPSFWLQSFCGSLFCHNAGHASLWHARLHDCMPQTCMPCIVTFQYIVTL